MRTQGRCRGSLLAAWLGLSAFVFGATGVQAAEPERWSGIDESIIEKVAAAAGRAPRAVLFDLQGDLALFVFLCAGIAGGAVFGYYFRVLFVEHFDAAPNGARKNGSAEQSREASALPSPHSAPSHAEARGG
jgi:cobalt/nickel transport protein